MIVTSYHITNLHLTHRHPCSLWLQLTTGTVLAPVMVEQLEWTLQLPNGKEENFTDAPKSIREVVLLTDMVFFNRWKRWFFWVSILGRVFFSFALDSAMMLNCQ